MEMNSYLMGFCPGRLRGAVVNLMKLLKNAGTRSSEVFLFFLGKREVFLLKRIK